MAWRGGGRKKRIFSMTDARDGTSAFQGRGTTAVEACHGRSVISSYAV
jgi:hypothetical protein